MRLPSVFWIEFPEQWEPTSVWADQRVRLAVNYALDRQAISEATCLGYCPPAGVIIPRLMDYALQVEPPAYNPLKARQLLAEAGYPKGFDAGEFVPAPPYFVRGRPIDCRERDSPGLDGPFQAARVRPHRRAATCSGSFGVRRTRRDGRSQGDTRCNPWKKQNPPSSSYE